MIYLDTHVAVWLYADPVKKMSQQVKDLINAHDVVISPAVRLELQYLFEIQRIAEESNHIVLDLSNRIGLKVCDKSFNTIITGALELSWTRDPFDRMIVANAAIHHDMLITKDENILANYHKAIW